MSKGPVSNFIEHHYRHFNAAALMDAAKGYVTHLDEGGTSPECCWSRATSALAGGEADRGDTRGEMRDDRSRARE